MKYILILLVSLAMGIHESTDIRKPAPGYQLIIFVGSDWCPNCRRLEMNILSDSLFISYLKNNDILIELIDFPQRNKQNQAQITHNKQIAEQYKFKGIFPTLILTLRDTLAYQKVSYVDMNVNNIIAEIEQCKLKLK